MNLVIKEGSPEEEHTWASKFATASLVKIDVQLLPLRRYSTTMAKKKKEPRNPIVLACLTRYGQTTKVMKDRRNPRGGNRNKQRDYSEGQYLV